jgi:ribonucleotide reductase alpha subunit
MLYFKKENKKKRGVRMRYFVCTEKNHFGVVLIKNGDAYETNESFILTNPFTDSFNEYYKEDVIEIDKEVYQKLWNINHQYNKETHEKQVKRILSEYGYPC